MLRYKDKKIFLVAVIRYQRIYERRVQYFIDTIILYSVQYKESNEIRRQLHFNDNVENRARRFPLLHAADAALSNPTSAKSNAKTRARS